MANSQATGGSAAATQPAREASTERENAAILDQPKSDLSQRPIHTEAPVSESASPATSNRETSSGDYPSEERIQLVAYQLWMDRGCPIGSPEIDWLEAERTCRSSSE
jgi:hypothetical protein